MRKLLIILGVLAMVSPVMATPMTTFTETWESYPVGAPGSPWYTDTHMANGTLATIAEAGHNHTPPVADKGFLVNDSGFAGKDAGNQAMLVPSGEAVMATNDSHLIATYYAKDTNQSKNGDWYFELSLGDVHAPRLIDLPIGQELANAIPVLAYCKPLKSTSAGQWTDEVYFFDGKKWNSRGTFDSKTTWEQFGMNIDADSAIVTTSIGPSSYDSPLLYLGGFDRVSINTRDFNASNWTSIDDISISGGYVVPEPSTVVLLGLGVLLLAGHVSRVKVRLPQGR